MKPQPPYLVRTFWSPDQRYLVTVHVTEEGIIALQDDNGLEWEPSGPQQDMAHWPPRTLAIKPGAP